jgi:hypothetical protein
LLCYGINTQFQSAAYNIANIIWNFLKGFGAGFIVGSVWELVGIIVKSFGKIATIVWNIIQLFSVVGLIFSQGADFIRSFLNTDLAGKSFIIGSIAGAIIGGLVVKGNADSISEVIAATVTKGKTLTPTLVSIVSSVKNIPGTNIGIFAKGAKPAINTANAIDDIKFNNKTIPDQALENQVVANGMKAVAKWEQFQIKARNYGVNLSEHASKRLWEQEKVGFTLDKVVDAYKTGTRYYSSARKHDVIIKNDIVLLLYADGSGGVSTMYQTSTLTNIMKNSLILK